MLGQQNQEFCFVIGQKLKAKVKGSIFFLLQAKGSEEENTSDLFLEVIEDL